MKDSGGYRQLAVRYYHYPAPAPSKKLKELKEKQKEKRDAYWALRDKAHFANVKSALIGCKECGSKIATKYMKHRNKCPVCGQDMRPQTAIDRESKAYASWQKAIAATEEETKRLARKNTPTVMWRVKIEYHV